MLSKRDLVLMAAGATAFHTLSHVILAFAHLPISFSFATLSIELTQQLNRYAIILSALITTALLWWVSKLK